MKATILTIKRDSDPMDPRKEYDNLGTIATWHRRYTLGDVQPKVSPDEYRKENVPEGSVELPVYMLDHSGLTLRTDDTMFRACDSQRWDWGQLGFIYCTPEKIKEAYSCQEITPEVIEKVENVLKQEIVTYNQVLQGEVWGYIAEVEGVEDSCWGFIGETLEETGLAESLPPQIGKELIEHAWECRE